jgi:hypothetical protein
MTPQRLLAPYFTQRQNRLVNDVPFSEYQMWQGINSSLLKEDTPWEALLKLQAYVELPPEMRTLLDIQGGDVGVAMQYLHDMQPRFVPRNFVTSGDWPATNVKPKPTDAQLKILERIANGEVDSREFNSSALKKCLENGWANLNVREVQEEGISEEVKHGRIEALRTGTLVHAAVLQPELFGADEWQKHWQLSPTKSLCSKQALECQMEDPSRELVTPEIIDTARRCRDAVWKHKEAARLLLEPGKSEVSLDCYDGDMQVMRKCRFDRLPDNPEAGIIDIKKTRKGLSLGELRGTIRQFSIHSQAAYYLDGLGFYGKRRNPYFLVFVTDHEPFMCRVVEINLHEDFQSLVSEGRGQYVERLAAFCLAYHENCSFSAYENEGAYPLHNGRSTLP